MASTRPLELPLALAPRPPRTASVAPRRGRSLATRLRALVTLDVHLDDLGLDDALIHADLADGFERGDC